MSLPEPSADALQASRALENLIREEIRGHDHWISFAQFMERALYARQLGYYAGGATKLGKDGDFTTAPEITPLFGQTLARFARQLMPGEPVRVLEFGAGSGKLAADMLAAFAAEGVVLGEYLIVELSAELRARQQTRLAMYSEVQWLDAPPEAFSGLVLANEVLDAMPVHLVVRQGDGWAERGVSLQGEAFVFADRSCDPQLAAQIPEPEALPEGYLTEVHPIQCGFVRSVSRMLRAGQGGAAVLIDYGFPASEYYLPQRSTGTLMCHYRHHAHPDPFFRVGLQDITAHLDFTALARAALASEVSVGAYLTQAAFLLAAGLPALLEKGRPEAPSAWLPQSNAVQILTSPAEMGELFKVLVLTHQWPLPPALLGADRSYRL